MSYHGILQWLLVPSRFVLSSLCPVSVDIPQEQLLDLPSMAVVLRFYSY